MRNAVALVLALVPAATASVAYAAAPQVTFAPLAGWHSIAAGGSWSYALNWQHRDNENGWADTMPRNGIAISVLYPASPAPRYPPLRLVMPKKPAAILEGAPDTPEYWIRGRVGGHNAEIRIDIRNPHPTKAQLQAAQRAISRITFE